MAGWYLDVVIGYLITLCQLLIRMWRSRAASDWQSVNATLCNANALRKNFFPHSFVEIVYTYHIQGGFYGGADEKPFLSKGSAQAYASRLKKGHDLVIRVRPGAPDTSALRDEDQIATFN